MATTNDSLGTFALPEDTLELSDALEAGKARKSIFPHLISLVPPLACLCFLLSGPHSWWVAPVFAVPSLLLGYLDGLNLSIKRNVALGGDAWSFRVLVWLLAALHLCNIAALVVFFKHQAFFSMDMFFVPIVVGSSSSFAVITAHELIHRTSWMEKQLGRAVLISVFYEHFFTEHVRGHHVRVGLPEDPATARFGETFQAFWKRTVPGQLKSAIALERNRLNQRSILTRVFGNRVYQGWAIEFSMLLLVILTCGIAAVVALIWQAYTAIRSLEAVNYFEHWGLQRQGLRPTIKESWDTDSWCTLYALTGLARHADHHVHPLRPYQDLQAYEATPRLPGGYLTVTSMVINRNAQFVEYATNELKRLRLGPFANEPVAVAAAASSTRDEAVAQVDQVSVGAGEAQRKAMRIPAIVPWAVFHSLLAFVFAVGIVIESQHPWLPTLQRNFEILCVFAALILVKGWLRRYVNDVVSLCIGLILIALCVPLFWVG